MKHIAIGTVAGLLVFATAMWVAWMYGVDFSKRGNLTGYTSLVAVVSGVIFGGIVAGISELLGYEP
ncbi:MAG: hypothetical protein OEY28_06245 [Nitrospira sp.]|nr:hypothetical protein [Nitrospira sp.]